MTEQSEDDAARAVPDGYIRGGGSVEVGWHRVATVLAGAAVLALLVIATVLTVQGAEQNSRIDRLHRSGVPVGVTVSTCRGMASGTGITESGFECRGTFTLDGRQYEEVIGGSTVLHAPGTRLSAVTVPGDPALVYTSDAVAELRSSWTVYATPAALVACALVISGVAGWLLRRGGA